VEEANEHAQADAKRRELRQLKNRIEGLIYSNERVYTQFRSLLPEASAKRIHEVLMQARVALNNDSQPELEAAMFDLNSVAQILSEVMLSNARGSGPSGRAAGSSGGQPGQVKG